MKLQLGRKRPGRASGSIPGSATKKGLVKAKSLGQLSFSSRSVGAASTFAAATRALPVTLPVTPTGRVRKFEVRDSIIRGHLREM
jgi:hypothetical protein